MISRKNNKKQVEKIFLNYLDSKNTKVFYDQLSITDYLNTWNSSGTFDAWSKLNYEAHEDIYKKENYKKIDLEIIDFNYEFNQDGFRSQEFKNFNSNNKNILVSGCSNTVGWGIPNEYAWPELLKNNNFFNNFEIYNLAITGSNIEIIIKNIITFINKVGKPDYIFILFPNMSRFPYFSRNTISYENSTSLPDEELQRYFMRYDYANKIFNNVLNIHLLESLCNLSNINLKWGTWYNPDNLIYSNIDFKNYVNFNFNKEYFCINIVDYFTTDDLLYKKAILNEKKQLDEKNINNKPYWSIGLDLFHPGTYWHECIANGFFESIKGLE